jgi:hypothetical protein
MPGEGRLRVYGQGDVEVELVVAYLTDLKHAYNRVQFRFGVRGDN